MTYVRPTVTESTAKPLQSLIKAVTRSEEVKLEHQVSIASS